MCFILLSVCGIIKIISIFWHSYIFGTFLDLQEKSINIKSFIYSTLTSCQIIRLLYFWVKWNDNSFHYYIPSYFIYKITECCSWILHIFLTARFIFLLVPCVKLICDMGLLLYVLNCTCCLVLQWCYVHVHNISNGFVALLVIGFIFLLRPFS